MGDVLFTVHSENSARLGRLSVGCRNKSDACHASQDLTRSDTYTGLHLEKLKQSSSSTCLSRQCIACGVSEAVLQKVQWNQATSVH